MKKYITALILLAGLVAGAVHADSKECVYDACLDLKLCEQKAAPGTAK